MKILSSIADETNLGDILNELGAYVLDSNPDFSCKAIEALGEIASKLP